MHFVTQPYTVVAIRSSEEWDGDEWNRTSVQHVLAANPSDAKMMALAELGLACVVVIFKGTHEDVSETPVYST